MLRPVSQRPSLCCVDRERRPALPSAATQHPCGLSSARASFHHPVSAGPDSGTRVAISDFWSVPGICGEMSEERNVTLDKEAFVARCCPTGGTCHCLQHQESSAHFSFLLGNSSSLKVRPLL